MRLATSTESKKIFLTNDKRSKYGFLKAFIGMLFILYFLYALFFLDASDGLRFSDYFFVIYGSIMVSEYFLGPKIRYYEFTAEGIYQPQDLWRFEKRKFLSYEAMNEVLFVVGDYVFRNDEIEIRLPKESLKKEDVEFLEEQMQHHSTEAK